MTKQYRKGHARAQIIDAYTGPRRAALVDKRSWKPMIEVFADRLKLVSNGTGRAIPDGKLTVPRLTEIRHDCVPLRPQLNASLDRIGPLYQH
jgi:hypothetical protein